MSNKCHNHSLTHGIVRLEHRQTKINKTFDLKKKIFSQLIILISFQTEDSKTVFDLQVKALFFKYSYIV